MNQRLDTRIYQISDINMIIKVFLPKGVKVNVTIANIKLRSQLSTKKTINFTKKIAFLYDIRFLPISFKTIR